jgi:hypothetical protein
MREADELAYCLERARSLHQNVESAAEECGRELVKAKEICIRDGRVQYAVLAKAGIPPCTAS